LTRTITVTETPYLSPTPTRTVTLTATISPTFSITPTWTITDTPLPTQTAVAPAVLSTNMFKPLMGQPLDIAFKAPTDGRVTIRVFTVAAEKVLEPFNRDVQAGQ
jgi:hypothetical protein